MSHEVEAIVPHRIRLIPAKSTARALHDGAVAVMAYIGRRPNELALLAMRRFLLRLRDAPTVHSHRGQIAPT